MNQCIVCGAERDRCPLTEFPFPRDCLRRGPRVLRTYDIRQVVSLSDPVAAGALDVIQQIGVIRGAA